MFRHGIFHAETQVAAGEFLQSANAGERGRHNPWAAARERLRENAYASLRELDQLLSGD